MTKDSVAREGASPPASVKQGRRIFEVYLHLLRYVVRGWLYAEERRRKNC